MAKKHKKRRNARFSGGAKKHGARPGSGHKRRNASAGGGAKRWVGGDWRTTLASMAGGGGGAALGGLVVNQEILSAETVGLAMALGAGVAAHYAHGDTQVVLNGVAAAGAGQVALALMGKRALVKPAPRETQAPTVPRAQLPAATPDAGPGQPRMSGDGGGVVVQMFRDSAMDLDLLAEDEARFGVDDSDDDEVVELVTDDYEVIG
jgi:hypothetical protein